MACGIFRVFPERHDVKVLLKLPPILSTIQKTVKELGKKLGKDYYGDLNMLKEVTLICQFINKLYAQGHVTEYDVREFVSSLYVSTSDFLDLWKLKTVKEDGPSDN